MQHKFKAASNCGDEDSYSGFEVAYIPHKAGTYFIEINDVIHSVSQFSNAMQVLEIAGPDDEVVIKLQTPGGSIDATDAFIHAMRGCKAPIHIVATGGVHSAGTAILLEAHSFELSENFNSLIHCGSSGYGGNTNEMIAHGKFFPDYISKFMRDTYQGFLSDKEIESLLMGADVWLTAAEWVKRHDARNDYIAAKIEALTNPPMAKKQRAKREKKAVDTTQESI